MPAGDRGSDTGQPGQLPDRPRLDPNVPQHLQPSLATEQVKKSGHGRTKASHTWKVDNRIIAHQ